MQMLKIRLFIVHLHVSWMLVCGCQMKRWQEQQLSSNHHDGQAFDYDGIAQDVAASSVEGCVQSETTLCLS